MTIEKRTESAFPINELLQTRWSPRAFADRPVEEEKLLSLFEAARWAPSAFNGQPWAFVVTTRQDPGCFAALVSTLSPGNRLWAPQAPVLVLAVAIPYRAGDAVNRYGHYDLGQAVAHLTVEARDLGLQVHQMGGFDGARARQIFELPAEYEPMTVLAIGYAGEPESLVEELRVREIAPRERRPIGTFVFKDNLAVPLAPATGNERD